MDKIKIFIVDDHSILRTGIKMLINSVEDMSIVGETGSGIEAIEKCKILKPDIILMDISLPDLNGLLVSQKIIKNNPVSKIIVLTMHANGYYLKEFLKIGAKGYVVKKVADDELINAIRNVFNGEIFIDPSLTKSLVRDFLHRAEKELSQREEEILLFLVKGYTNKEIAEHINRSVKTVETYRARIMEKLNLYTRAELVEYANQKGIVF